MVSLCGTGQISVGDLKFAPAHRKDRPPPPPRGFHATPHEGGCPEVWDLQASHLPHDAPFVRDASTRIRHRYPHRPKSHGACQCRNHHDLPSRHEKARSRCSESAGSFLSRKFFVFLHHPEFLAWQFLHGALKNRLMNGIPGEVFFRAVFAPVEPHAVVTGQMPHATY